MSGLHTISPEQLEYIHARKRETEKKLSDMIAAQLADLERDTGMVVTSLDVDFRVHLAIGSPHAITAHTLIEMNIGHFEKTRI